MPGTAGDYGIRGQEFDPVASLDASGRYQRDLHRMFGNDSRKSVAAYNWGQGNVQRNGLGKAPPETVNYVNKVYGGLQSYSSS